MTLKANFACDALASPIADPLKECKIGAFFLRRLFEDGPLDSDDEDPFHFFLQHSSFDIAGWSRFLYLQ